MWAPWSRAGPGIRGLPAAKTWPGWTLSALTASGGKKGKLYEGLTRDQLIQAYRVIYTSRRIDDRDHAIGGRTGGEATEPARDRFVAALSLPAN